MHVDFPLPGLPAAGTIHIWLIELDRKFHSEIDLNGLLSAEEQERAARFIYSKDASRFRVCRAMLRIGLGWYLQKNPREIALKVGQFGKPYLAESCSQEGVTLYFNVSHSEGLGAIAFTTLGDVGIDVEAEHRSVEAIEIASSYFSANEAAAIAAAETERERIRLFLRIWTRKEAVLKAAGCGIQLGLEMVDVLDELTTLAGNADMQEETWKSQWLVRDIEQMQGFAGAVAAPAGKWSMQRWTVAGEDAVSRLLDMLPGVSQSRGTSQS